MTYQPCRRHRQQLLVSPEFSRHHPVEASTQLALYLQTPTTINHSHTHTFNGPLSGTTRVSWYQKGETDLDFTEARDSEWQWHQLGHMQVCTSLQTDNHTSTPLLSFLQAGCPSIMWSLINQSTKIKHYNNYYYYYYYYDKYTRSTAGWASGRAEGLQKLTDEMLVWLSVWSEAPTVCIWSS